MRCDVCGEKIALAQTCPYCGNKVKRDKSDPGDEQHNGSQSARGQFRGSMGSGDTRSDFRGKGKVTPSLANVLRFLLSPEISTGSKMLVFAALFYVLSPIDLLPGAIVPVIGWLDDVAVMYVAWKWMESRLSRL